jgi:glycosyltransferase involved in cell wall biosynthesis
MGNVARDTPFISILIPAFNNAELLAKSVRSVLNQTFTNFEVIISDDCSPTDIFSNLRGGELNDPRVKIFRQKRNLGVLGNQIFLLGKSQGTYSCFLQHDDYFLTNTLFLEIHQLVTTEERPNLIIGNAIVESISDAHLIYHSKILDAMLVKDWCFVPGKQIAPEFLGIDNRNRVVLSWSSVFFNRLELIKKHGFTYLYLSKTEHEAALDAFSSEENMIAFWLLLEKGKVAMTPRPISFRGRPVSAFSTFVDHPGKRYKNDIEFFNLYRASKLVSEKWLLKLFLARAAFIGYNTLSRGAIKYLGLSPELLALMIRSKYKRRTTAVSKFLARAKNSAYWHEKPNVILRRILNGPPSSTLK